MAFRRQIKARSMEYKVPIQIVRERRLRPQRAHQAVVKVYNNHGELTAEINTFVAADGSRVVTNTQYGLGEQVSAQTIAVRDNAGKVSTQTVYGGKVLP